MRTTKGLNKKNVGAGPVSAQKGITLIALVITIIVMLILVAVTITMAVNGGLFEYAGRAGTQMNGAIVNEQELANLEANMTVNELINKYTDSQGGNTITFTLAGVSYTVAAGTTWGEWIGTLGDGYGTETREGWTYVIKVRRRMG